MGLSAHSARSRTVASRVNPTWGVVWWGKVARHNNLVLPSTGNNGRNGRGIIAGCLRQLQITMGFHPGKNSSGMAARTP